MCKFSLSLLFSLVLIQNAFALNGSFKTYLSEAKSSDPSEDTWSRDLTSTFRPKFTWAADDNLIFYGAYALTGDWQKHPIGTAIMGEPKRSYRAIDLDSNFLTSTNQTENRFYLKQNLDRLYLSYSIADFNLNVGRAPVAFGSAKIVNPTDVLTPLSYQTLDKEERVGVDTVRANLSLGPLSLLDIGYVFGNKLQTKKSAMFTRLKLHYLETDISTILMDFQENFLVGVDLARSVGKASAWFESAYVMPKYFSNSGSNNLPNYYRATLGMDYKLTSALYSYVEYHYNGAGTHDAAQYMFLQTKTAYTEGGVTLQGVHYLIPGATYEISSLWKLTGQFLYNINDSSIFNNALLEYGFAEDVFVDAGFYLPFGSKKLFPQKSEFGAYPKILYSSLRFYF
jgi:hypothetical protein